MVHDLTVGMEEWDGGAGGEGGGGTGGEEGGEWGVVGWGGGVFPDFASVRVQRSSVTPPAAVLENETAV